MTEQTEQTLYDSYRQGPDTLAPEQVEQLDWAHSILLSDASSLALRDEALLFIQSLQGKGSDAAGLCSYLPVGEDDHPARKVTPHHLPSLLGQLAHLFTIVKKR